MGRLLTTVWNQQNKYQVSLGFARRAITNHAKYLLSQPKRERVNKIPIMLSESGDGKSTTCTCIADDLGIPYCRWDPDAQLFDDNLGVPDPAGKIVTNPDGTTKKVTENMEAAMLPIFEQEALLLEISELPTASKKVLNQLRQIVDSTAGKAKFNNREVSPNCILVATGNPLTADYTTVEAELCHSIEERLHPYIVVPEKAELLAVWSIIMKPTVYQFILNHDSFFNQLTPRGWMGLAVHVEAQRAAGESAANIVKSARAVIDDTISPPLLTFLQSGYQPDKVPILGRELLGSSVEQFAAQLERVQRWFSGGTKARGYIGATQLDVIRVIAQSDNTFTTQYPEAGERFTGFCQVLMLNNAADIVSSLCDAVYRAPRFVRSPIMDVFKKSDVVAQMGKVYHDFVKKFEKVLG